jgi:CRP-like cAMP-binding protein
MNEREILGTAQLRLDENCRWSTPEADVLVVRAPAGSRRLVLRKKEAKLLSERFAKPTTVPAALTALLAEGHAPPLRSFYELVVAARAAGVLVSDDTSGAGVLLRAWRPGLGAKGSLTLAVVLLVPALIVLTVAPWRLPSGWLELLLGWLLGCVLLSAGTWFAACTMAGAGAEVRRARLNWRTIFPHFSVDFAEALMAGRPAEEAVALWRVTPVLLGAAVIAWWRGGLLAPLLTAALYASAPWGLSAMRQWLSARYEKDRHTLGARPLFQADDWTRWRAWWTKLNSTYGRLRSAWVGLWATLALMAVVRLLPGMAVTVQHWLGAEGHRRPLLEAAAYTAAAVVVFVVLFVLWTGAQHWRIKRSWSRLPQGSATYKARGEKLAGDKAGILRQIPLFQSSAPEVLQEIAAAMEETVASPGGYVFREDDPGDAFYLVLEGELDIHKRLTPESRRSLVIGRLGPGDGFGEIALMDGAPRTASIRARTACRLARLSRENFERLVVARVGAENVRVTLQAAAFLSRLAFLGNWPFEEILRFAQRCSWQTFPAGALVLRKGVANNWFYLIYDGRFEARLHGQPLRQMRPGDYFGEISLLGDGEATADVVALEESRCLTLNRGDFLQFFARDFQTGLRIESIAAERKATAPKK